jgi:alpha-beta hydrolase superfamily lysophospholipase
MTTTCTRHPWTAPDGETFSYSLWQADLPQGRAPRAIMVAVHGLSGAALDYEPLGRHLARHGVTTFAPELRGQGNDSRAGRRGDLERLDDWYADLHAFFALVRRRHPGVPVYAYGESMGAALLTRFFAQAGKIDRPAGLVLASPVIALPRRPAWWQQQLFRFFLRVRPTHRIDVRKLAKPRGNETPKYVTRDEAHRKWFETAAHKLDRYTLRFFKNLHDLIAGCFAAASRLHLPVLVVYAAHDVFISPAKVEEFFALLAGPDKELRFFSEAYHLLLHDHDKARVLERIETWLLSRLERIEELPSRLR